MKYVEGSRKVFLDTGTRFPREVIWSVCLVKYAAAKSNLSLGLLDRTVARAVMDKAKYAMNGKADDRFVVDVFQTGSGTGLNMNANEVIAELASAASGKRIHPNDHVNMSQSSNDVGPTAVRIAAVRTVNEDLLPGLIFLSRRLAALSRRTATVYKAGRTHLRDALPVTMGQEFGAFADAFDRDVKALKDSVKFLLELPIGGTAVGTGLNADPRFGSSVTKEIAAETGMRFVEAKNKFRATRLLTDVAFLSSVERLIALDLFRLCQDLRLMFSGPMTGLAEIDIPTQEEVAGSSIMPGKTNPITVESAVLACAEVMGMDAANQIAASLGEFELAMGVPLMGYNMVVQTKLLSEALNKVGAVVVDHVVPNRQRNLAYAESSPALITVISPKIGYDKASKVGKRLARGVPIREALKELGYSSEDVDKILDLKDLVRPGIPSEKL